MTSSAKTPQPEPDTAAKGTPEPQPGTAGTAETAEESQLRGAGLVRMLVAATVVLTIAAVALVATPWPLASCVVAILAVLTGMTAQMYSHTTRQRVLTMCTVVAAGTVLLYEAAQSGLF